MGVGQMLGSFPKIVAVVGSDARPDERRDATRADSIHLVGLDGKGNAGIVGIPRDSWVPIPGAGTSKINASLAFGGPDMMMDTFVELTDLNFDGYVLTGFAGFRSLIEILGGLKIDVPRSFNDKAAKAYLDAGEQILDGAQALAMSRARKTMPRGDFTRQEHGGLVIMAAQAMIRAAGIESLPAMVGNSQPFVSTNLDPGELLVLAAAVRRVHPDKVVNKVAAGGTGSAGGASVVFLSDSAAELWEDLADGKLETGD
jgi:LCP family protein required for cell wall assembly